MFAEPSVMAEQLLPYLLRTVDRYPEGPLLVARLTAWAQENVLLVLDGLAACKELVPGTALRFFQRFTKCKEKRRCKRWLSPFCLRSGGAELLLFINVFTQISVIINDL